MYRQSEKKLLSSNISSTRPHNMVNFGPLAAKIGLVVWGSTANFNGFHVLAALLQRRCSMETNQTLQCLAISWAGTLHRHFRGFLPRYGILPGAKFTSHPPMSCALIFLVVLLHSTWAVGANQTLRRWAQGATYIWQGDHHVGHWPTF